MIDLQERFDVAPADGSNRWTIREISRFTGHLEVDESGCWSWGADRTLGYGRCRFRTRKWRTHRLVFQLLVGPITEGMHLDHLCPGVPARNASKTHCPKGHPYDGPNLGQRTARGRRCRACRSIAASAAYQRKKAVR